MSPKISFVVPYYRKEKSVAKALRSLLNQSVKDIEVIVVMDGPDPRGEAIISRFKKVKLIKLPKNVGAPAARNAGAKVARGEFISFWDADCYIEPGAAAVWLQIFDTFKEVDFVYSGYRFPEGFGGIPGEPFDPWMLEVNNYISGMFPIRRKKAPVWDESLQSLQDWDFWLQAVKEGCKGFYSRGYAFKTDLPDKESISGKGCSPENWLNRLETVKKKHGIPLRTTCVAALQCREEGVRLSKMIDADYRDYPTYFPNRYDQIVQIGFSPRSADAHAQNFKNDHGPKVSRILFWRAADVYSMRYEAAAAAIEALALAINSSVDLQFCEDESTKKLLRKLGFKAVCLPLPLDMGEEEIKPLPDVFKVLVDVEPEYKHVFDSIKRALPDVSFQDFVGSVNVDDYSVMIKFGNDRCIDLICKKLLLSGRRLISNINSPHCGYVEGELKSAEAARLEVIRRLRELQDVRATDVDAVEFYRKLCSPATFKRALNAALGTIKKPEAVS